MGTDRARAVGVDIGGTKILGAVVDRDGNVREEHRIPSEPEWPEMREAILEVVRELRTRDPGVTALGVGAAGMVDLGGTIHYAPNVPGFRRLPVQQELGERTGLPTVVDNDANTAAYAELQLGAARGMTDAMVITLGTGIGGGMIVGGRILRGAHGFASEVGHFQVDPDGPLCACGEPGHWEAIASGNALGRMARQAAMQGGAPSVLALAGGQVDAIRGQHVSDAGVAGEPDALAIIDRYSFNVAIGLVGLANIFDPGVIAIAGGLVNDGDLYLVPVRRHFLGHIEGSSFRTAPEIVPSQLGEHAGVIGAAVLALDTATGSEGGATR
jgi:glucokinase